MFSSTRLKFLATGAICFLAGCFLVYGLNMSQRSTYFSQATRTLGEKYEYIDPLLLCNNDTNGEFGEITSLEKIFEDLIKSEQNKGVVTSGSIYFRNIADGRWVGVNENTPYSPASLLKVPILIAYLKAAETNQKLLGERAYYRQDPGQTPPLIENPILVSGQTYSVENLLHGMIIDSDNTATKMLIGGMKEEFLGQVYSELGLSAPYATSDSYQISTRTYALFFRILYNATYLNREMSEKALSILSQVKFDKGLVMGTSVGTPIAHKYGYAILQKDDPHTIELSDCGIVYQPNKPYLLCVMARGTDPDVTATFIKDVALATNHYVANE